MGRKCAGWWILGHRSTHFFTYGSSWSSIEVAVAVDETV